MVPVESYLSAFDYHNENVGLSPLQDNGGATWTHALLPGGVAVDNGSSSSAPLNNQRGVSRPQGSGVDIGAVEMVDPAQNPDSDGDGLSDADEKNIYHTDSLKADTDGDGFSDGFEVQSKSDPNDPNSFPDMLQVHTAIELELLTNRGHQYQLESTTNLVDWTAWGEVFEGAGGRTSLLVSTKGTSKTYFRLKRVQ